MGVYYSSKKDEWPTFNLPNMMGGRPSRLFSRIRITNREGSVYTRLGPRIKNAGAKQPSKTNWSREEFKFAEAMYWSGRALTNPITEGPFSPAWLNSAEGQKYMRAESTGPKEEKDYDPFFADLEKKARRRKKYKRRTNIR